MIELLLLHYEVNNDCWLDDKKIDLNKIYARIDELRADLLKDYVINNTSREA